MNLRSSGLGGPQEQDCPPCPSSNDETGSSLWSYPPRPAKVLLLPRPYPQDLGATRVGSLWPGLAPSLCVKLWGCWGAAGWHVCPSEGSGPQQA